MKDDEMIANALPGKGIEFDDTDLGTLARALALKATKTQDNITIEKLPVRDNGPASLIENLSITISADPISLEALILYLQALRSHVVVNHYHTVHLSN